MLARSGGETDLRLFLKPCPATSRYVDIDLGRLKLAAIEVVLDGHAVSDPRIIKKMITHRCAKKLGPQRLARQFASHIDRAGFGSEPRLLRYSALAGRWACNSADCATPDVICPIACYSIASIRCR
jgi:hypothetical protein